MPGGDTTAPTITGLRMFSDGGPYAVGDTIAVRVTFSERIVVMGTPTLEVTIGTTKRVFSYVAYTGIRDAATFEYTVQCRPIWTRTASALTANSVDVPSGASIRDAAGNDAAVSHDALSAQSTHKVDTTGGGQ